MTQALKLVNGVPRVVDLAAGDLPYDQIDTTGYAAGSNVTLPLGETYTDTDLLVMLDGIDLTPGEDYNYVGVAPRTQIQLVIEVFAGEVLRFRK